MKAKKFFRFFVILGLMLGSLTPWQVNASEDRTLRLAVATEPVLDPAYTVDKNSTAAVSNLFDGLVRPNIDGELEPAVCESYEISDDLKTYTFKLRKSKWSDGVDVTAEDFEYAWRRVLTPETASPGAAELFIFENAEEFSKNEVDWEEVGVKAIDDLTLEVTLKEPLPHFLELTGRLPELYPVPKHIVENNPDWAVDAGSDFVSNGPFKMDFWNHNSDYQLAKNEEYFAAEDVYLEAVHIQVVESRATANNMYLSGDLDYLGMPFHTVSPETIDIHEANGELEISNMAGFYNYAMNINDPHLSNPNIRKALALAVDRKGLVENITKADQVIALRIIGPTATNSTQDISYFEDGDFDKAREYLEIGLEELGLSSPEELDLKLSTNISEEHSAVAQYVQAGWARELGVNVGITQTEFQVHLDNMRRLDYQIGRRGEGYDYTDISAFLEQYYSTDNGRNHTGWSNPKYQELVDEARSQKDDSKREELLLEAEAIFMEDMPVVPLYFYTNACVVKDNVHNCEMDTIGVIQFKDVYKD